MNFEEFIRHFGTEKKCENHIKNYREKQGIICTNCSEKVINWRAKQKYWRCKCGKKISLKSGTLMESSKLKFTTWFKAIFLMTHIKKPYSTAEIARILGIKRYRTVWYLVMKLRCAMGRELLAKDYFQFLYIFSHSNERDVQIKKLKNYSVGAIRKKEQKGDDEINLLAPLHLHLNVNAEENRLNSKGYRCKKILGVQNTIEWVNPLSPIKPTVIKWLNKLHSNTSRILNGIHHGVHFLHLQKYLFEFSFNYNYRKKDKFQPLFNQVLGKRWQTND